MMLHHFFFCFCYITFTQRLHTECQIQRFCTQTHWTFKCYQTLNRFPYFSADFVPWLNRKTTWDTLLESFHVTLYIVTAFIRLSKNVNYFDNCLSNNLYLFVITSVTISELLWPKEFLVTINQVYLHFCLLCVLSLFSPVTDDHNTSVGTWRESVT